MAIGPAGDVGMTRIATVPRRCGRTHLAGLILVWTTADWKLARFDVVWPARSGA